MIGLFNCNTSYKLLLLLQVYTTLGFFSWFVIYVLLKYHTFTHIDMYMYIHKHISFFYYMIP